MNPPLDLNAAETDRLLRMLERSRRGEASREIALDIVIGLIKDGQLKIVAGPGGRD
jgi:hypothetical protein